MRRYIPGILLSCCLILSLPSEALCGISDAAVLFLRIAPGARSAGMGDAFVAISDDASATHWNPAGLGEYPLAHSWHQFKLTDDTRLKDLAEKALKSELKQDFFEKIQSWQIKGNELSRFDNGTWRYSETINVDSTKTVLENLSRFARTSDESLFKLAARKISLLNTGVSFNQINDLRLRILQLTGKDEIAGKKVNGMMEAMLVYWHDLRFDADSFAVLKDNVDSYSTDDVLSADEIDKLENLARHCQTTQQICSIEVPYPVLLTVWHSWDVPWEEHIIKIAVMENDVPNDNYSRYDIWAVTNFGLRRHDGVAWRGGDDLEPKRGDKLRDIISRALGTLDEEIIASKIELVARVNNVVSRERLAEIKTQLETALPDSINNREEFSAGLEKLDEAWLNCLLNSEQLVKFVDAFKESYSDSMLTESECDKIFFALEKIFRENLSRAIRFPYEASFDGKINDLVVDHKTLWLGTDTGLYQYRNRRWEKFSTGSENEAVWCVESVKRDQLWIGTDSGIKHYKQSKWTSYGTVDGISATPIKHIFVKNEQMVYAATDDDLFYFDGKRWSNSFTYVSTATDSALSVVENFYGQVDRTKIDLEVARLQLSAMTFFTNPSAGVEIKLPFKSEFESRITALLVDNNNNLWVGTELGIKRFDGQSWYSFGYKPIKVEREMTADELAAEYVSKQMKTSDPDLIASFANIIRKKNTLIQDKVKAGNIVYVYENPAGSPIQTLYNYNGRVFVGARYSTFSYKAGQWERYYHEDLHRKGTNDIVSAGGELWLATPDRVVVFAHARKEISFTHANWLPELASDLYYEFFTYVQPVGGLGTVGLNVTFLSYGEIARTTEFSSDIVESFHSFDGALTLSYGTRASKNMAVGMSAKVIYSRLAPQGAGREIGQGTGTSFAVEVGILYAITKKLRFGACITNLGPDMSYIDAAQSDPLPRNIAVGFSYKLLDTPYNRLTLVGEVNKLLATVSDDFSTEMKEAIENVGIEYWYGSILALRAGYIYDSEGRVKTATLGVGLQYKGKYRLDFAYIPSSETLPLANTLRTSLTVRL